MEQTETNYCVSYGFGLAQYWRHVAVLRFASMNSYLKILAQIFSSVGAVSRLMDRIKSTIAHNLLYWFKIVTTFPLINTIVVTCLTGENAINAFDFLTADCLVGRIWWINWKANKLLGNRLQSRYRRILSLL
jgi:hypothetical protein